MVCSPKNRRKGTRNRTFESIGRALEEKMVTSYILLVQSYFNTLAEFWPLLKI